MNGEDDVQRGNLANLGFEPSLMTPQSLLPSAVLLVTHLYANHDSLFHIFYYIYPLSSIKTVFVSSFKTQYFYFLQLNFALFSSKATVYLCIVPLPIWPPEAPFTAPVLALSFALSIMWLQKTTWVHFVHVLVHFFKDFFFWHMSLRGLSVF